MSRRDRAVKRDERTAAYHAMAAALAEARQQCRVLLAENGGLRQQLASLETRSSVASFGKTGCTANGSAKPIDKRIVNGASLPAGFAAGFLATVPEA
jgi:hypothetical protein